MVSAALYPFVLLVQCDSHAERLNVFGEMLEEEEKRLQAKMSLRNLFGGGGKEDDGGGHHRRGEGRGGPGRVSGEERGDHRARRLDPRRERTPILIETR